MSEEVKVELGIEETMEALAMLKKFAVAGAKVWDDQKINVKDLGVLVDLAKDSEVILAGFKDLDLAKAELKDLSQEELILVVMEVFSIVKAMKA